MNFKDSMPSANMASSGHRLGQIIGDWYEEYFALPLLTKIANGLNLFVDSRFKKRSCRGDKILWADIDGNTVDYDFVMELAGTDSEFGTPVAFFETFWRRGARHSKDKARDDSGKLLPMKDTYPTARVLGIVSAGNFTTPARELVRSRGVELFYVPKEHIVKSWKKHGIEIDYPDKAHELIKQKLVEQAEQKIKDYPSVFSEVALTLCEFIGKSQLFAFEKLVASKLGATPQEYKITAHHSSNPFSFTTHQAVDDFLCKDIVCSKFSNIRYSYEVVFGDGDTYLGQSFTIEELKQRHLELKRLIMHMEELIK